MLSQWYSYHTTMEIHLRPQILNKFLALTFQFMKESNAKSSFSPRKDDSKVIASDITVLKHLCFWFMELLVGSLKISSDFSSDIIPSLALLFSLLLSAVELFLLSRTIIYNYKPNNFIHDCLPSPPNRSECWRFCENEGYW